jgi:two-component system LytT family response regulator
MSFPVVSSEHRSVRPDRHLLVKAQGQFQCIPATKIVWCESAGNYVQVHLGSDAVIVRSTLTALAARLVRLRFERISRTTIVNLDCVLALQPTRGGEFDVLLQGGWARRMTRRYRAALLDRFVVV